MIAINDLKKEYKSGFSLYIDRLSVKPGERVALIGSNGSGKSTLLKLLAGILQPDSGVLAVHAAKNEVGYEPQSPYCYNRSVYANVKLGLPDTPDADAKRAVADILAQTELTALQKHRPATLSGGEAQRMCFARMLVRPYKLLLLDEPLSAVDIDLAERMENVLLDYCRRNNTTLLVSTHLPLQAVRLSDKLVIMNGGRIVEYGDTDTLLHAPQTEFGRKFLNNWRLDGC